jgi:hypothetical protein
MCRQTKKEWKIIQLSTVTFINLISKDHKPDLELEKIRILDNGGVVEKQKDQDNEEVGPYRVWAPKY